MDDLCANEKAILATLQSRHAAELVFTRCGTIMISLHPHAQLPHLFAVQELQRHRVHALGRQLPPHIFELGTALIATCQFSLFASLWKADGAGPIFFDL